MLSELIHAAPLIGLQTIALLTLIYRRDPVFRNIVRGLIGRKEIQG